MVSLGSSVDSIKAFLIVSNSVDTS